jgi:hypothetical protein
MSITLWDGVVSAELLFEPRDMWIGVHPTIKGGIVHIYIILPPFGFLMLPIHIMWRAYEA